MIDPARQRGFSLLEILVAFTLFALAMAVLMQIFSRGVNGAGLAERYQRASLLAESRLATLGVEEKLVEGETEGKFDDTFSWTLSVKPWTEPPAPETSADAAAAAAAAVPINRSPANSPVDVEALLPVRLFAVTLTIRFTEDDKRERRWAVSTLMLGEKT